MKTVILCGGRGTRLGEYGTSVAKPMLEIGGRPILWHILKLYSHYGLNDFVLCVGHLGDTIRRYFTEEGHISGNNWRITFSDTGAETNTGGRINRVRHLLEDEKTFCVTYGDGLADIDLKRLTSFHMDHGRTGTLVAVRPKSNFGLLELDQDGAVTEFREKPEMQEWVNGGFFVFNRRIFDYLHDDAVLERESFEHLAAERELMAYRHGGFWKCVDTYKDYLELNDLFDSDQAYWKVW